MKPFSKTGGRSKNTKQNMRSLKKQILNSDLWLSTAAECLATFIFLFVSCVSLMFPDQVGEASDDNLKGFNSKSFLQINIGIALIYATLIQCFESVSGAYMNPAVTLAMVVAGHVGVIKAAAYVVAQFAGAFSAVALCFGLFSNVNKQALAISRLNEHLGSLQGFGIEILLSFILTVTWLATLATSRSRLGSSALPVGMAYLANSLWGAQFTGACINPARSLPPAVLAQDWTNLWVFIAGPFTGSFIGALLYSQLFTSSADRHRRNKGAASYRKAEGESIKSDLYTPELDSDLKPAAQVGVSDKRILDRPDATDPNTKNHNLYPYPCDAGPPVRKDTSNSVPNLNKIQHLAPPRNYFPHSSMMLSSPDAMHALRQPATSTAPNSANVTLARGSTKPLIRPSTACGEMTGPTGKSADKKAPSCDYKQTALLSHKSASSSEPFSDSANILLNDDKL